MAYQQWDIALHEGELAETEFATALRLAHVEHKDDRRAQDTGNVFVEFHQRTGRSGIETTEAHYWATKYAPMCWIVMPTHLLRELTDIARARGMVRNGGDFDNQGAIIPLEWLLRPWQTIKQPPS